MKTLKLALASALLVLSMNSFAETCNPCTAKETVKEDSVILYQEQMPNDIKVSALLQQMTSDARSQVIGSQMTASKTHKHDKRNRPVKP